MSAHPGQFCVYVSAGPKHWKCRLCALLKLKAGK